MVENDADRYYAAVYVIGKDQTGLLKEISSFIHGWGGDIENSLGCVFGNDAYVSLRVFGKQEDISRIVKGEHELRDRLAKVGEKPQEYEVMIKPTEKALASPARALWRTALICDDKPGLLAGLTELLERRGLSIVMLLAVRQGRTPEREARFRATIHATVVNPARFDPVKCDADLRDFVHRRNGDLLCNLVQTTGWYIL